MKIIFLVFFSLMKTEIIVAKEMQQLSQRHGRIKLMTKALSIC